VTRPSVAVVIDGRWELLLFSVLLNVDDTDRRTAVAVKTHIARDEDVLLISFHSTLFQLFILAAADETTPKEEVGILLKRHDAADNGSTPILRDEEEVVKKSRYNHRAPMLAFLWDKLLHKVDTDIIDGRIILWALILSVRYPLGYY